MATPRNAKAEAAIHFSGAYAATCPEVPPWDVVAFADVWPGRACSIGAAVTVALTGAFSPAEVPRMPMWRQVNIRAA